MYSAATIKAGHLKDEHKTLVAPHRPGLQLTVDQQAEDYDTDDAVENRLAGDGSRVSCPG